VNEAAEVVTSAASGDANIIFGAVVDDALGDELRVTVIATGFGDAKRRRRRGGQETAPVPVPAGAPRENRPDSPRERPAERPSEGFEIPDEVLDVPSFLRDS